LLRGERVTLAAPAAGRAARSDRSSPPMLTSAYSARPHGAMEDISADDDLLSDILLECVWCRA
jgi:hypothetical protein